MKKPELRLIRRAQDVEIATPQVNITREITIDKGGQPRYSPVSDDVRLSVNGKYPFYPKKKDKAAISKNYDSRKWLNVRELAEYLGTTVRGIRALVYRDRLAAYKPFGILLFNKADIDRYIESKRVVVWYEKN